MALGLAPAVWVAAIVIFVAHLGGGTQWALSTYGLQVVVPDYIRGRVFAVDFALITLSLGISSLVASAIADSAGPRIAAFVLGGFAVAWAGTWWIFTRNVRRATLRGGIDTASSPTDEFGPPEPEAVALGDR